MPLFCIDGQYYKWVHKSLQEYFAAQFIFKDAKDNQDKILTTLYNSDNLEKYINIIDLYYDIDNWGFRKNILLPFCQGYVNYYNNSFFTSDIICKKDIDYRISKLYMREMCMFKLESVSDEKFPEIIEEIAQKYMTNGISYYVRFRSNNICTANYHQPQVTLLPILQKRLPHIINTLKIDKSLINYEMPENEVVCINSHTGDNNTDEFIYINYH